VTRQSVKVVLTFKQFVRYVRESRRKDVELSKRLWTLFNFGTGLPQYARFEVRSATRRVRRIATCAKWSAMLRYSAISYNRTIFQRSTYSLRFILRLSSSDLFWNIRRST